MPTPTPIAGIPIPSGLEKPNGPDQLNAMAVVIESRLVNRFNNATDRTKQWADPSKGSLSYILDKARYEYWSGASWLPVIVDPVKNATRALSAGVYTDTDRYINTAATPALATASVKLTNPSISETMHYMVLLHSWTSFVVRNGAMHIEFSQDVVINGSVKTSLQAPSQLFQPTGSVQIWSGILCPPYRSTLAPGASVTVSCLVQLARVSSSASPSGASALMTATANNIYVFASTTGL